MNFRLATPEDIDYMAVNSINQTVDRKMEERVDYIYALEDESLFGIGGFRMIVPTTAWCWVDLTEDAKKNVYTTYRVISEWMDEFVKNHNIKRLQAFVKDIPRHKRLVEHLGFEVESTMKDFYGDEDAFLYRRLF